MLIGVAFVPAAPALLPDVGRGLDAELAPVRTACRAAITRIAAPTVVVLAAAAAPGEYDVGHVPGPLPSMLPGPGAVGARVVLDALGDDVTVHTWAVNTSQPAPDGPYALVVVGDGSARRSEKAPGHLDPKAEAHDGAVAAALRSGDPKALRQLPDGEAMLAAGTEVWRTAGTVLDGDAFDADLLYDDAPFGVGYFVATWTPRA